MAKTKSESEKKKPNKIVGIMTLIIIVIVVIAIASSGDSEPKKVDQADTGSTSERKSGDSGKTDFTVGDVIAFDGREITVTSVERNYSTGNEYAIPKDGKEFVKIDIKIENKSDDKLSYNAFDWKIQDSNGTIEDYTEAMLAQPDNSLGSGDLTKGGKKSGSIVFQVPKGDKGLILHFESSIWSSKSVEIKL